MTVTFLLERRWCSSSTPVYNTKYEVFHVKTHELIRSALYSHCTIIEGVKLHNSAHLFRCIMYYTHLLIVIYVKLQHVLTLLLQLVKVFTFPACWMNSYNERVGFVLSVGNTALCFHSRSRSVQDISAPCSLFFCHCCTTPPQPAGLLISL